jgi:phosphosulfolactate synthase (CoM biosynthesis protein A)
MVHLPEAEIFLSDLDNDRSYVADRDIGLLTKGDAQLETLVRQGAEARMVEAAMANDIIDQANQEAEKFVSTFLEELGFEEVIFTDDTPPLVTPYVQELPKGYVGTATAPALVTPSASVP